MCDAFVGIAQQAWAYSQNVSLKCQLLFKEAEKWFLQVISLRVSVTHHFLLFHTNQPLILLGFASWTTSSPKSHDSFPVLTCVRPFVMSTIFPQQGGVASNLKMHAYCLDEYVHDNFPRQNKHNAARHWNTGTKGTQRWLAFALLWW